MNAKAGRGSDQFILRLPDGMRERIKAEAEANNRSMNAEIVARLEASCGREAESGANLLASLDAKLDALLDAVEQMRGRNKS